MTSPYLEPVDAVWSRAAGWVLLASAVGLTALLGYGASLVIGDAEFRRHLTSSSVVFALMLVALCGICWQAGYRLTFDRPDRSGTLFSWPTWLAMGTVLVVLAAVMASVIVSARSPTAVDYQIIASLGALGVWCLILAYRARKRRAIE